MEDDSRLICQLSHLVMLSFVGCDLTGLNLDDIGNCRELKVFYCDDVTHLSFDEIRKLATPRINEFIFKDVLLNDSDLEELAKWANVEILLCLE